MAHAGQGAVTTQQTALAAAGTTSYDLGLYTWQAPTPTTDLFSAPATVTIVNPKLVTSSPDDSLLTSVPGTTKLPIATAISYSTDTSWATVTSNSASSSAKSSSTSVPDQNATKTSGLSSSALTAIIVGVVALILALVAFLYFKRRKLSAKWDMVANGRHRKNRSLLPVAWGGEDNFEDEKGSFIGSQGTDGMREAVRGKSRVGGWGWATDHQRNSQEEFRSIPYANEDRYGSVSSVKLGQGGYEAVGNERGWAWGTRAPPSPSGRRPLPTPDPNRVPFAGSVPASPSNPAQLDALLAESRRRYGPEDVDQQNMQRRSSLMGRAGAALHSLTAARSKRYTASIRSVHSTDDNYDEHGALKPTPTESSALAYAATPPKAPALVANQPSTITRSVQRYNLQDQQAPASPTPNRAPSHLPPILRAGNDSPGPSSRHPISPRLFYSQAQSPQGTVVFQGQTFDALRSPSPAPSPDPFGPYTALPRSNKSRRERTGGETSPIRRTAVVANANSPAKKEARRVDALTQVGKIVNQRGRSNSGSSLTDLVTSLLNGDRD